MQSCSDHKHCIVVFDTGKCPMCELEQDLDHARSEVESLRVQLDMAYEDHNRLSVELYEAISEHS
jgi:hypothetical protein